MSTPTKHEVQAAFGQRIYEYQGDDGVTYYSFTRAQSIISPPQRLKMKGRVGVHLVNFLTRLRRLSETFKETSGEGG